MQILNCEYQSYNLVEIKLELNEVITSEILCELVLPEVNYQKGVILSGRAPTWIFSYLTGIYHIAKYIAIFDPKFNAAVVTKSHSPLIKTGFLIAIDEVLEEYLDEDSEILKNAVENNDGFTTLESI